ncbi:MAG: glycogen synthase, partial [Spirochaetales bacterium]|nr:glycogen synthase [Spirochaetales bacterium]
MKRYHAAMKILMAASEAVPYAKSGGLGDVVGALSEHLYAQGIDLRVIIPRYGFLSLDGFSLVKDSVLVPVGFEDTRISVYESAFPGSGTPVWAVDHPLFSQTDAIYGSGDHPYFNNAARFALLSRAVFPVCRELSWIPDIIHTHDWPTGLTAAFLAAFETGSGFSRTKTIHSIHNLGYQGVFSKHDIHETRLSPKELYRDFDYKGDNINFMVSALTHADYLTTVSPTYAAEIQTPEHGFGLEDILSRRSGSLSGILNGIDYSIWNPETDPALPSRYSEEDLTGKAQCKKALAAECGFPDPELPLFAMISRLVEQKGFRDLFDGGWFDSFLSRGNCNYIILGTGESWAQQAVMDLDRKHGNFKGFVTFDEALAHRIEAGSDFFVMPSRYEPCG